MIRMDHEKPKSRFGNRPRDLVRLNKMKRRSWTSDPRAGRGLDQTQSASWVQLGSAQLSWTECSSVRQLDRVQTVTGPHDSSTTGDVITG
ncbi:hypothetical protein F2Q69_00039323 [Brassica cretica]|uniref:Uncharacterized protein n=1 Tax=Brassica cretica TaxID=69181 RepID=A0A8S9SQR9_BRACR|nr:hypothetical protein F2Q69_00039323 [Brassica cretica]